MKRMSASHTPEATPPVGIPVAVQVPSTTATPVNPLRSVMVAGSAPGPGRNR
jgi:hypothetical protein